MMKFIIGFDISKEKINYCVTQESKMITEGEIVNTKKELKSSVGRISSLLESYAIDQEFSIHCVMEYTGIYNNLLLEALLKHDVRIYVVHAAKIKTACGIDRLKTDKVDARKIAEYGFRFFDKLDIWKPLSNNLKQIKILSKKRDALVKTKNRITQGKKDFKKFLNSDYPKLCTQIDEDLAKVLDKNITQIEEVIEDLIKKDSELHENYEILNSIPGVGPVMAIQFLVKSDNFTKFESGKQFACYCGVVPFERSSGAYKGKSKVSNKADKELKTLVHMGAVSISRSNCFFGQWYARKVAEGKNPMSVLNALRNKIIITAHACVRNKQKYSHEYVYDQPLKTCG